MSELVYLTTSEYPSVQLTWNDSNGNLINFASGYTFTVILSKNSTAVLTKTSGIVGAATAPNITINWAVGELDIAAGNYSMYVIARDGASKDRVFNAASPPQIRIVKTPQ